MRVTEQKAGCTGFPILVGSSTLAHVNDGPPKSIASSWMVSYPGPRS